jgi:hypothetical protein
MPWDWPVQLQAAAISVLGAIATTILWTEAARWWRRPRLRAVDCAYYPDPAQFVFYVTVENCGRSTAEECVGQMGLARHADAAPDSVVRPAAETLSRALPQLGNIHLTWLSQSRPEVTAIRPHQTQRICIGELMLDTFLLKLPLLTEGAIRPGPGYDVVVRITSSNSAPVLAAWRVRLRPESGRLSVTIEDLPLQDNAPWWRWRR